LGRSGQFALLVLIHGNPGINQTFLSRNPWSETNRPCELLSLLEEEKFIVRQRCGSRFCGTTRRLTAKGRGLMDEMHVAADKHEKELHRILGGETASTSDPSASRHDGLTVDT